MKDKNDLFDFDANNLIKEIRNFSSHLFELVEADVHETSSSENLEHLVDQISRNSLHQSESALDRILRVPNLAKVVENGLKKS